MRETQDILAAWSALPPGSEAILATVIETTGSTYRRAGARMLITAEGWMAGSVSGGCLESELVQSAWEKTAGGPAAVTYDAMASDDIVWGFGLGCNGTVRVLLQRLPSDGGVLSFLAKCIEARKPGRITTLISPGRDFGRQTFDFDPAFEIESSTVQSVGVQDEQILIESLLPPLALTIFGAGHDAKPVIDAAKSLGWHVTVVDPRSNYATKERFPNADAVIVGRMADLDRRSAVVVMNHNYVQDFALLKVLLPTNIAYLGLLGPRRRTDRMLDELDFKPTNEQLLKLHAPVGLDLGAKEPHEIAVAIVAEILADRANRAGGPLSREQREKAALI